MTRRPSTPQPAGSWSRALGELYNAGPFTPWVYRADGCAVPGPPSRSLGEWRRPNWGGVAFDPATGYVFVVTQDLGLLGWMEAGSRRRARALRQARPPSIQLHRPDRRRDPAVPEAALGPADGGRCLDRRHRVAADARHHRRSCRPGRQDTGRPIRAAAIVTGGGLLFVAGHRRQPAARLRGGDRT